MKKLTTRRPGGVGVWIVCIVLLLAFLSVAAWIPWGCGNTSGAEASNIVSNLRNLAQGVLAYADDPSTDHVRPASHAKLLELVLKYQDNPEPKRWEGYFVHAAPRTWWIGYDARRERQEVRQKLADRAPRTGLFGSPAFDLPPLTAHDGRWYTPQTDIVWLPVRVPMTTGARHAVLP